MILENLHKKRFVRDLLCRIGRHDYEAVGLDRNWMVLECFYCERRKKSYMREARSTTEKP